MTLFTTKNFTRALVVCLAGFYLSVISEFFDFNIMSKIPSVSGSALAVTLGLVIFLVVFALRARHRH
ncbi:hypothetical protein ISG33_00025 [Glaciecola sp. MH2013]|uniref:hypothetical protein n=1 Tax=Glaciecola sp. MH2013 TaxID=2785524 RepID=UPI00189C623D|nr:hypothetical protein [Glaciecola sp. MH2013]MBF7071782.1 hypothetical protein [Glaciecola sp. MH2013]